MVDRQIVMYQEDKHDEHSSRAVAGSFIIPILHTKKGESLCMQ
nr:MAG TPA: hypothetical protein [Caudoviricetes sp.]